MIYLDYTANTPVEPQVLEAFCEAERRFVGRAGNRSRHDHRHETAVKLPALSQPLHNSHSVPQTASERLTMRMRSSRVVSLISTERILSMVNTFLSDGAIPPPPALRRIGQRARGPSGLR